MQDNLVFLFEDISFRLARYLRRKFGKKLGSDEKSLTMFYKALRHTLSYYKDVDEESALVGIEFLVTKLPKKDVSVNLFLVLHDRRTIEVKNSNLADAVTQMFGPKLVKDGKIFFHWKQVEEFEDKLNAQEKR